MKHFEINALLAAQLPSVNHRGVAPMKALALLAVLVSPLSAQVSSLGGGSGTHGALSIGVASNTINVQFATPQNWASGAVGPLIGGCPTYSGWPTNNYGGYSWVFVSNPTPPIALPGGCAVLYFDPLATTATNWLVFGQLASPAQIPYPVSAAGYTVQVQIVSMPIRLYVSGSQWTHGTTIYSCSYAFAEPHANETCDLFGLGHFHISDAYSVVLP